MLFSEIYSSYFRTVEAILDEAVQSGLTDQKMTELVREKAFAESVLSIPSNLKDGTWPLLTEDLKTPLAAAPRMPLTQLEKRWLKALLQDPRIRLFSPSEEGLEDVEPLYSPDTFVYFDQYNDGDPFDDPAYIAHFQLILQALRAKRVLLAPLAPPVLRAKWAQLALLVPLVPRAPRDRPAKPGPPARRLCSRLPPPWRTPTS